MMLVRVVGLCVMAAVAALLLRQSRPELALVLVLAAGVLALLQITGVLGQIITSITALNEKAGIDQAMLLTILKVVGIAYVAEFGAQLCKDAGAESLASKVALAGKVLVLAMSLPMINSLLDLVLGLMQ